MYVILTQSQLGVRMAKSRNFTKLEKMAKLWRCELEKRSMCVDCARCMSVCHACKVYLKCELKNEQGDVLWKLSFVNVQCKCACRCVMPINECVSVS